MAPPPPPPLLFGALLALLAPSASRPPAANTGAAPVVQVTVGVLLPESNLRLPWAWPRVAPALSLALEALQPQLSLDGLAVRTAFASTDDENGTCYDQAVAEFKAAELKGSHDLDVLLGLSCSGPGVRQERFRLYWRLPLLRVGLYEEKKYDSGTEVFAGPVGPDFSDFLDQLQGRFNWTAHGVVIFSVGALYQHNDVFWWALQLHSFASEAHSYQHPGEAIRFIQAMGRVVYLSGPLEMLQEIMQLAQEQNMTKGDYVFFYLDLYGESLRAAGHREAAKPWQSKESNDTGGLREAFQSVLVFTLHEPQTPEYQRFEKQLILRAQRDFGMTFNDSMGHLVAGCFHDLLLLYLRALNETLREGGTKRDTSRILEKMKSLKIQGVTGTMRINSNNNREMDFDLWAMRDVETGEYQVVAHYIGSEKQINWTGPIHWKKGRPPHDNPPYLFDMDDSPVASQGEENTVEPSQVQHDLKASEQLLMVDGSEMNGSEVWLRGV